MEKWIEKMNEMFEANVYTDDKRVTVVIVDDNNVRVRVLNDSIDINVQGLTDYGAMMVIMSHIDRLYNDGKTIMLSPEF